MTDTNRRMFLGALAFAASGLAATRSLAVGNGDHAAGYDVAPASNYVPLIPRRPGEHGAQADPLSVIQALMEAERTLNLEAAVALFADGAVIVNVTGRKTADREELRWLINTEIWLRDSFQLDHLKVEDNRVSWDEAASEPFYQSIGVAPVCFVFEAVVQKGHIMSIVAHLPLAEISRIRQACKAQADEPLIHGGACSEFVQLAEAHTKGSLVPPK
jgi:hypothetical protein